MSDLDDPIADDSVLLVVRDRSGRVRSIIRRPSPDSLTAPPVVEPEPRPEVQPCR